MRFRNPFRQTPPDTTTSELIVIGRNDAKTLAQQAQAKPKAEASTQARTVDDTEHRVLRLWDRVTEFNKPQYADIHGHHLALVFSDRGASWVCETCHYGGRADRGTGLYDQVPIRNMVMDVVGHLRTPPHGTPKAEWWHGSIR